MAEPELKPCPFCGAGARIAPLIFCDEMPDDLDMSVEPSAILDALEGTDGAVRWVAECLTCPAQVSDFEDDTGLAGFFTPGMAAESWNRRAVDVGVIDGR